MIRTKFHFELKANIYPRQNHINQSGLPGAWKKEFDIDPTMDWDWDIGVGETRFLIEPLKNGLQDIRALP
jgi:hypothetical protein